jgi:hypothetical protein
MRLTVLLDIKSVYDKPFLRMTIASFEVHENKGYNL